MRQVQTQRWRASTLQPRFDDNLAGCWLDDGLNAWEVGGALAHRPSWPQRQC